MAQHQRQGNAEGGEDEVHALRHVPHGQEVIGAKRLPADGLHATGQPLKEREPSDVDEGGGHSSSSQGQRAQVTHEGEGDSLHEEVQDIGARDGEPQVQLVPGLLQQILPPLDAVPLP